jgi:hypothetical protein
MTILKIISESSLIEDKFLKTLCVPFPKEFLKIPSES